MKEEEEDVGQKKKRVKQIGMERKKEQIRKEENDRGGKERGNNTGNRGRRFKRKK